MHTFKNIRFTKELTIKEYYLQKAKDNLLAYKKHIAHLKELQAPTMIIDKFQNKHDKLEKKIQQGTYKPQLTYKDVNCEEILNTIIKDLKEEYNRNNKFVGYIINNKIKINYATRYCPIISLI